MLSKVNLKAKIEGEHYVQFNQRQTKLNTNTDCHDFRTMLPKIFGNDQKEKHPILSGLQPLNPKEN